MVSVNKTLTAEGQLLMNIFIRLADGSDKDTCAAAMVT